ncbi:unnamed protein product [Heterobilharzia americana]|nr:unnamed protein product [Heterobilharzia americana]
MAKVGKGYQIPLSWVPAKGGPIPERAISIADGVFVVRCRHNGQWIPGKAIKGHSTSYYGNGGQEIQCTEYEFLCDSRFPQSKSCYEWLPEKGGRVPKNAIVAGMVGLSPVYVAKGVVNGKQCVGKVHEGHTCAHLPSHGVEYPVDEYEVLVLKKKKKE